MATTDIVRGHFILNRSTDTSWCQFNTLLLTVYNFDMLVLLDCVPVVTSACMHNHAVSIYFVSQ